MKTNNIFHSMSIPENMKSLPKAYWIPKMHKSLIGARFIIARKCR